MKKKNKETAKVTIGIGMGDIRGELKIGEPHPASQSALDYITGLGYANLVMYLESYSSCAIEGNRLGEICSETLSRLLKGQPVSDRYVLGLAWSIRNIEEKSRK